METLNDMEASQEKSNDSEEKGRSSCVVSRALDIVGDKWTLLIVRDMLFFNKKEYNEFLKSTEAISTNILAHRLKLLVSNGICTRRRHPTDGKKILYELTDMGSELASVVIELGLWAKQYLPGSTIRIKSIEDALNKDKVGYSRELVKKTRASRIGLDLEE